MVPVLVLESADKVDLLLLVRTDVVAGVVLEAKDQMVLRPRLLLQKYPDTEVDRRLRLPEGRMLQAQDRRTATTGSFFAACLSFFGFETRPKLGKNRILKN